MPRPFSKRIFAVLCTALLLLGHVSTSHAVSRGISVQVKKGVSPDAPVEGEVDLYSESYALIIGIDAYSNGWPPLSNAIKDAQLVAATMRERGFQVDYHENLNSEELDEAFEKFFIIKGDNPNARLFVWFAGHGNTLDGEGYLVPADAPVPRLEAEFKYSALNMRRFETFMRQARAKHVFSVFDSCFAGTVFNSQRAMPPAAITNATTKPVRQFLTSGDADQTVSDDGTFRQLFLRAINGEENADSNDDGYLTGSELGLHLGDRITNLTQAVQTPRYGKLRDKDYDLGDFVFVLPSEAEIAEVPDEDDAKTSAQIAFWESVKDSNNKAAIQAYLDQYPDGIFSMLAKLKIAEIDKGDTPPVAQLAKQTATASDTRSISNPAQTEPPVDEGPSMGDQLLARLSSIANGVLEDDEVAPPTLSDIPEPQTQGEQATGSKEHKGEKAAVKTPPPLSNKTPVKPRIALPDTSKVNTMALINGASLAPSTRRRMQQMLRLAEGGNSKAQFSLGYMFDREDTIKNNKLAAVKWYEAAANDGNTRAQVNLGRIFEQGAPGVEQNWDAAIRWYQMAADAGDADAQQHLGYLYENGLGLAKNPLTAAEFYQAAAEQGRVTAQNNLGRLYQLGNGVQQDTAQAQYWYQKAAAQGSAAAKANLEKLKTR